MRHAAKISSYHHYNNNAALFTFGGSVVVNYFPMMLAVRLNHKQASHGVMYWCWIESTVTLAPTMPLT
jgi:hypothetical protein